MTIASDAEREKLIEGGRRLRAVLVALGKKVAPGVSSEELDDLAEHLIREGGDTPSLIGYSPDGAVRPFPATLCVSINDEVVHGIPNEHPKTLKEGDIVGLDLVLTHEGMVVDAAITVQVGHVDGDATRLLRATQEALYAGIEAARPGAHMGDIGHAIQQVIERAGLSVVKDLGGHGVGGSVHEEPFVPNYGRAGTGMKLVPGMVLALEPIAALGKGAVTLAPDGYTYRTKDGSRSAHFEHTILIEIGGALVVTK